MSPFQIASIIIPLLQLLSILQPPTSNLHQDDVIFSKLTGTWQRSNGRTHEKWEQKPDGSFFSVMYSVRGADTTIQEEVTTTLEGNRWVYAVKGAGNAEIVRFPSVEVTPTRAHFSNPAHDFPTDIVYELVSPTELRAYIVGPGQQGKTDTVRFNFKKMR